MPERPSRDDCPRVAITLGDINGVGPEVILRGLSDSRLRKRTEPIVIGSAHVLMEHARLLGLDTSQIHVVDSPDAIHPEGLSVLDVTGGEQPTLTLGEVSEVSGRLSMQAVEHAVDLCKSGEVDAMVTAPINKEAIVRAGYRVPGHTEFIARRTEADAYTMMMCSNDLRIGLVSTHLPLSQVTAAVTKEAILEKVRIIDASLRRDFGIDRPKIAVLGLNPHAGDGGAIGREELDVIGPAIEAACSEGHLAFGPFPADGFFAVLGYRSYDAILAMYHDQGLIPFKAISFNAGVNFTAGLPIVRTSPDHGTAFDIAGKGKANPASLRQALYTAVDIARRRRAIAVGY